MLKTIITFICASLFCLSLSAQKKEPPVFDTHHKSISLGLLGNNIGFGVNYDMRLNKGRMDGIGVSAGIGGINLSTSNDQGEGAQLGIITFPLEFNHIVGKRRHGFVSGVGLLPAYAAIEGEGEFTDYEYVNAEGFGLVGGFIKLGYRLQPLRNGFTLEFDWNPLILRGSGFNAGWFGLSFGMGFK